MYEVEYTVDNTITYDCKKEVTTEEVDELYHEILGKERVDKAYDECGVNMIEKGKQYYNTPVSIEKLREILDNLEKEGCNYVSIDYNCDHSEYTLSGLDVHVSTEIEVEEQIEKEVNEMLIGTIYLRKAANDYIKKAENIESNFTNRVKAMRWWDELPDAAKTDGFRINGIMRNSESLTGREIEEIWNTIK